MNTSQAIARQKLRDTPPVGNNWLETFRQAFPDEFSEPEDEQARSSIERGNGQRTMAQRPGRV